LTLALARVERSAIVCMSQLSISTLHLFCTRFSFGHQLGARSELALHQHVEHSLPLLLPTLTHLLPRDRIRRSTLSLLLSMLSHLLPFRHDSCSCSSPFIDLPGLRTGHAPVFSGVRHCVRDWPSGARPRDEVGEHSPLGGLLRRVRDVVHIPLQLGRVMQRALERGRPWRFRKSAAQHSIADTLPALLDPWRMQADVEVVRPWLIPIGAAVEYSPCTRFVSGLRRLLHGTLLRRGGQHSVGCCAIAGRRPPSRWGFLLLGRGRCFLVSHLLRVLGSPGQSQLLLH
jgi:hypothetical protein